MKKYHRVLTIATSDSGGGAGVQADLKTFSALGCYGMSVFAALTAQNTSAVTGIFPIPPAFIAEQIDAVMTDIGVDAVKIGMVYSAEIIDIVAQRLAYYKAPNIVVDPVMVSKSGSRLLQDEAVEALKTKLLPLAALITPNLPEASVLLGRPVEKAEDMAAACGGLAKLGSAAVLLKGGHLAGEKSPDLLYANGGKLQLTFEDGRVDTRNTHGTGCTLSSAIAAGLAKGLDLAAAVRAAKDYISAAIRAGAAYELGKGHGPVHHFYAFWE
ncbi:MAG: bifunctional hydroxymethylpyrimidine kinase/phosphomethylpyrimidine kinase [Spirochaetales bacterium]|jgi:hydroxymethylpyrimidine/phosphomethylpyrimidine kinase|nr:bifunctional hydroxymethylpyrimidine kinase/phosphomethylpyrimidine kinase [Spirochaetales bacterium]